MRHLILIIGLLFLTKNFCDAQISIPHEPQLTLQKYRLSKNYKEKVEYLLHLGSFYLMKPEEYKSDLDSALLLANQAKTISEKIRYSKGKDGAQFLIGKVYVETKQYSEVNRMLKSELHDTIRLQIMYEIVKYKFGTSGRTKSAEDTIKLLGEKVLKICQLTNSYEIAYECQLLMNNCSPTKLNTEKVKVLLANKYDEAYKNNDVGKEIRIYADFAYLTDKNKSNTVFIKSYRERIIRDFNVLNKPQKEALINGLVATLTDMAISYYDGENVDDAIDELNRAIQLGKNSMVIDVHPYEALAHVYLGKGMTNLALKNILECRRIMEFQKTIEVDKSVYTTIARVYLELGKFKESGIYLDKAIDLCVKKGISIDFFIINYHTVVALALNKPKEELSFLRKYRDKFSAKDFEQSVYLKNVADCFVALKQYEKAEQGYLKCQKIYSNYQSNAESTRLCFPLGKLYVRMKRYDLARTNLNTLIAERSQQIISIKMQRNAHLLLFQIDSATRNYASAISHLQTYKTLNDSIFNDTKQKQIEELQIKYEIEQKDKEIILKQQNIALLTNKNFVQEANLQNANWLRNIIIISALFLLGVLYIFYLLKQRHNTRLQAQQLEINQRNEQLNVLVVAQQKLVSEKEWLVKEVHHRVKNNLQIVVSLLNTQAAHLSDGDALAAIQESRHRMQVISLLHQKLYQVENDGLIDIQVYIKEVISYLKDSFEGINHLFFEVQIAPISLDISQAVPVGLILNEAITNAIKYAFPKNKNGLISVSLERTEDENLRLIIKDNGIGLPKGFNPSQSKSLGMQLMQTLSEQLDGNVWVESQNGTIIKVIFKPHLAEKAAYHTNSLNATLNYDQQNTHR